jgi:hypothetical protein
LRSARGCNESLDVADGRLLSIGLALVPDVSGLDAPVLGELDDGVSRIAGLLGIVPCGVVPGCIRSDVAPGVTVVAPLGVVGPLSGGAWRSCWSARGTSWGAVCARANVATARRPAAVAAAVAVWMVLRMVGISCCGLGIEGLATTALHR